jgi:hypothetical protein
VPQERLATFGFEEFWAEAYGRHAERFDAIAEMIGLANEMLQAAENRAQGPFEGVICDLTRATVGGANDVVLLCGNGCGAGAMKIARGKYESRWTAEYLRRNPKEVNDYVNFGPVQRWRTYHWLRENFPDLTNRLSPEAARKIE